MPLSTRLSSLDLVLNLRFRVINQALGFRDQLMMLDLIRSCCSHILLVCLFGSHAARNSEDQKNATKASDLPDSHKK